MEKYTVDIDKVLDDFEQSEALEAEDHAFESCIRQSSKISNNNDFSQSLVCNLSSSENATCSVNCSPYCYLGNHSPGTNFNCPKKAFPESDFTASAGNAVHHHTSIDPNLHSNDFDVFHKPFQSPLSLQENLSHSSTTLSNSLLDANAVNRKCLSEQHSLLGAISNSSEDAICVRSSVNFSGHTGVSSCPSQLVNEERNHLLSNSLENFSEKSQTNVHISKEHIFHCEKNKVSQNSFNVIESVLANANDCGDASTDVSALSQSLSHVHQIESESCQNDLSESLDGILQCASLCEEQKAKSNSEETTVLQQSSGSYTCDASKEVIHEENVPKLRGGGFHSVEVVNFSSDAEEPQISLEEMNEYLNDISNNDQAQDEDSGVSSQEDINGNNLAIELFNKEGEPSVEFPVKDSKNEWKAPDSVAVISVAKSTDPDENSEDVIKKLQHVGSEIVENVAGCSDACVEPGSSPVIKTNCEQNIHCTKLSSFCEDETFNRSVVACSGPSCSPTSVAECGQLNNTELNSVGTLNFENFNCGADQPADTQQCTSLPQPNSIPQSIINETSSNVVAKGTPAMKLVFFPTDGTFRSVPADEIVTSVHGPTNQCSMENNNANYDIGVENDGSALPENHSYPSRLQRPTTLNLPYRSVGTANIVTSYIDAPSPLAADNPEVPHVPAVSDATDAEHPENEILLSKIGKVKPFWIPDSSATNCMHCGIKFTVIKRRHHCRACGKVLCSRCCNQKARLPYLSNREDRVCQQCIEILAFNESEREKDDDRENGESPISSSCGSSPSFSPSSSSSNLQQKGCWRPHPNNPDDYCSTISPLQQVQELANRPPPTVMVPVGVLKRGNKPRGVPKQVIFSDGIRPGGDLTDLTESVDMAPPYHRQGRRLVDKSSDSDDNSQPASSSGSSETAKKRTTKQKMHHKRVIVSDSDGPLPPILLPHDCAKDKMDLDMLFSELRDEASGPVTFAVTKNIHVLIKIIKLDCCFGNECWCFASRGLCTVGQDEVILILELFQDEDTVPRDAFRVFSKIYDNASKGVTVGELGHLIFPDGIFGSWEHRGFLFVRPTFQCLSKLVLPSTPYLFAILIQKWEVPWAKVFPLRLMLRLGAECRYYPCSLVSVRFRKPLYFEIGQTIMSVLADLRNFQFTIPFVPGLVVHMEEKKTCVNIPKNRYEKLMKVLNSNNVEHVLSLGANFSTEADSHLVCMQKDEGDYQTQAINIQHTTRKVTGASFIVFSGALKSSTGLSAKFSIVEDGLLVQIPQETMSELHSALRDMRDLTIKCGQVSAPEPEEVVMIQWTAEDKKFNIGVISPIDKRSLEGVPNLRIHTATDYAGDSYLIRWTEVFFLESESNIYRRRSDSTEPCRIAETVAQAFCMSLIPYLDALVEADMTKIGLRITLDAKRDMVEYDVGSLGQNLPSMYMNALDSSLIPVLSRISVSHQEEPVSLELIFYILIK